MGHTETWIDGVWYPSVTTILGAQPKPWLERWYAKWGPLAKRKTKIAGIVGTEFHRCVESYIETGAYNISVPASRRMASRIHGMMDSFIDWAERINGEVHHTELKVISRLHTYSGTIDAVGTFEGKPTIYDWKTSSGIYDDMGLQLVAYAQAYKEQTGIDIGQGLIVCVSKGKPTFVLITKFFKLGKRLFNRFLKLRQELNQEAPCPK